MKKSKNEKYIFVKLIFPLSSITINLFITDEVAVTTVVRSPSGHRKRDRL